MFLAHFNLRIESYISIQTIHSLQHCIKQCQKYRQLLFLGELLSCSLHEYSSQILCHQWAIIYKSKTTKFPRRWKTGSYRPKTRISITKSVVGSVYITGLHTQKAYTHGGTSSPRILLLYLILCSCIYAFCLRIAIRQPMRTPWCMHIIAYKHERQYHRFCVLWMAYELYCIPITDFVLHVQKLYVYT